MPNHSLLLAVLCAASVFAQDAPAPPPEEAASLSGVVTNSLTGDPLLHAHVMLRPMSSGPDQLQYGALSDGEGKFSITQIPPGSYIATVEKSSYTAPSAWQPVKLGKGEKQSGLKLKLTPGGVITGRVLDAKGEPMENIRVSVMTGGSAMTDEEGRYRIGGLAPGRQRVVAFVNSMQLPPEHRTDGTEEQHYANTFYPSTLGVDSAQWVQIRPGAETAGVDIRMIRVPISKISGRVVGLPANTRASLQLRSRSQYPNLPTGGLVQPRADGTFEIWRTSPGKYWLQVGAMGGSDSVVSAPMEVDLESTDIENLELKVLPPETIQGIVRWDGEPPQDTAPAAASNGGGGSKTPVPPRKQLFLNSAAGFAAFGGGYVVGTIADDGTFTMQRVQPGKYNLRYSDSRAFVKGVRVGSRESDGSMLDLSSGSGGEQLVVTLGSGVASLSGVVRKDGEPVQGIGILLLEGEAMVSRATRQTRSGADGSYKITGLTPGTYKLVLVGPEQMSEALSMPSLFESQEVTLAVGENANRDLRYTPVSDRQ